MWGEPVRAVVVIFYIFPLATIHRVVQFAGVVGRIPNPALGGGKKPTLALAGSQFSAVACLTQFSTSCAAQAHMRPCPGGELDLPQ